MMSIRMRDSEIGNGTTTTYVPPRSDSVSWPWHGLLPVASVAFASYAGAVEASGVTWTLRVAIPTLSLARNRM